MKLEISVSLPDGVVASEATRATVVKLLVRPGDTIRAGGRIALIKKEWADE